MLSKDPASYFIRVIIISQFYPHLVRFTMFDYQRLSTPILCFHLHVFIMSAFFDARGYFYNQNYHIPSHFAGQTFRISQLIWDSGTARGDLIHTYFRQVSSFNLVSFEKKLWPYYRCFTNLNLGILSRELSKWWRKNV